MVWSCTLVLSNVTECLPGTLQLEAHSPKDWTPELTQRLRDLVDELGELGWSIVRPRTLHPTRVSDSTG